MAIKLVISNRLKFKVRGTIKDEAGIDQPFDFSLICARLDTDQIQTKIKSDSEVSVLDFMVDVIEDWSGVRDEEDQPLAYSEENFRRLCKIAGVGMVAYRTYMAEVGAKEKN